MKYELSPKIKYKLNQKRLVLEKADINDLEEILNLYKTRASWFKLNNINQRQKYLQHHPQEEFIDAIKKRNYFVLKENENIVAAFELSENSKYWHENANAYYIYKLVVKVGYKNLGSLILDICKEITKNNKKSLLRLDCLKNNKKLNEIYEKNDFKLVYCGTLDYYVYCLRENIIN